MYPNFKYSKRKKQAERHLQQLIAEYDAFEKRLNNNPEDLMEFNDLAGQIHETKNWISLIQTEYLQSQCRKLIIPIPEHYEKEYYSIANFDDLKGDRYIFTTEGILKVKMAIKQENRERLRTKGVRAGIIFGIIGALTGLIGGLIGLITILNMQF